MGFPLVWHFCAMTRFCVAGVSGSEALAGNPHHCGSPEGIDLGSSANT